MASDDSKKFEKLLHKLHNILRSEGVVGIQALLDISNIIAIKLLEQRIDEFKLPAICKFSNIIKTVKKGDKAKINELMNENEDGTAENTVFDEMSKNEYTKMGFSPPNYKKSITFQKLVTTIAEELGEKPLTNFNYDAFGTAYEHFIKTELRGKVLGQFFTNRKVVKFMIEELLKPTKGEKIYDPACGTGGFLIYSFNYLVEKYPSEKDKKTIQKSLFGCDINKEVAQLLSLNFLLHGIKCDNKQLQKKDSLLEAKDYEKYECILSNPPFGVKVTMEKGTIDEYYGIKNLKKTEKKKGELLFIKHIINILTEKGRACVIVPEGVLYNTDDDSINIRKELIEKCCLGQIIRLPKKIFENTDISTSILYFSKGKASKNIKFVEFIDKKGDDYELKLTQAVSLKKIRKNFYKFDVRDYIDVNVDDTCTYKNVDELFDIEKGKLQSTKNDPGEHTFITIADTEKWKTHKINTHNTEAVFIANVAPIGKAHYYSGKFIASNLLYVLQSKGENISLKFYYHYFKYNINILEDMAKGTANQALRQDDFKKLKVPVPSLETQKKIAEQLDRLYDSINNNKKAINCLEFTKKLIMLYELRKYTCEEKKLNDICEFQPAQFKSRDLKTEGKYPMYIGKATNPSGFYDEISFDLKEYIILVKGGGCPECVDREDNNHVGLGKSFYVKGKSAAITGLVALIPKNKTVKCRYLHYYLNAHQNDLIKIAHFTTRLGNISMESLLKFNVEIPSVDAQKAIIKKMKQKHSLIKTLQREIEQSQELIKLILDSELKNPDLHEGQSEKKNIDEDLIEEIEESPEEVIHNNIVNKEFKKIVETNIEEDADTVAMKKAKQYHKEARKKGIPDKIV